MANLLDEKEPIYFGDLALKNPVFYAPLAGCSDFPFRQMSAKYGPALMFCEMVKMDALVRNHSTTLSMLEYEESMRPIGAQICGSKPEYAAQSAKMMEDLGFDVLDLNCGCPVDKVTKDGSGSALLKTPEKIGEILANAIAAVNIPVTLKVRAGWDDTSINAHEITKVAEDAGAKAIFVHGRTREQAYRGPANWNHIKACVDAATTIKVIGNGDVNDPESAERMLKETGCDGVLVARGTMGSPWIVEDILRYFSGRKPLERTVAMRRLALLEHFERTRKYSNDKRTLIDMRRVGCWYFKKSSRTKEFRSKISHSQSVEEVEDLIRHFSFDS